jgi:hypothetical protein
MAAVLAIASLAAVSAPYSAPMSTSTSRATSEGGVPLPASAGQGIPTLARVVEQARRAGRRAKNRRPRR